MVTLATQLELTLRGVSPKKCVSLSNKKIRGERLEMALSSRWKKRPNGSTWGDFGADDQLGRLNLLTPEKVRQGVAEVREGITFCLSLPLDYPGGNILNPRRFPPVLRPTLRNGQPNMNYVVARDDPDATDVVNDDAVILHLQYSTQWDSLAHVSLVVALESEFGIRLDTHYAERLTSFEAARIVVDELRA